LGLASSKVLPLASTLSPSKVPVGNNADYIENKSHKAFSKYIKPRFLNLVKSRLPELELP
jgi:hypothetical protein